MHYFNYFIGMMIASISILVLLSQTLKKRTRSTIAFSYFLLCLLISAFGQAIQILFIDVIPDESLIYFDYFVYIGGTFLPVAIYNFVKVHLDENFKFNKNWFFVVAFFLIILWTNNFHHLFYVKYSVFSSVVEYGLIFYPYVIYSYSLILVSLITLLRNSAKSNNFLSPQNFLILLGISIPLLVNVLGLLDIFQPAVNVTSIAFTATAAFFFIAIFKFDFLNIKTIANKLIIDTLSDPYIVIDNENIVVSCDKSFSATFKIKKEQILNKNIFSTNLLNKLAPNFKDDLEISIDLIKNDRNKITIEKFFEKFNKYFLIDISPILKNDSYVGTLIFFKDITQEERDKQRIQADQDLLIEQERFASLGQMIGGISHNLKTPIFSIAGGLEGLSDLIDEFDESIDDANVTSEDMHSIAKDMKEWIHKMKGHNSYMSDVITAVRGQTVAMSDLQNERFTIKELFDEVLILMQHELKQKLTNLNVSNNVPYNATVVGNINSLVQVINNLISNSIEAYTTTDKERIINLSANYDEEKEMIYIVVQDFGPGLPESIQKKVFKEMVTTKGKYGTGLGLFMSYSNIKAHFKGDLTFETETNKGTTFTISIPSK